MNNLTTAKRSGIKWGPFTMRIPFIHIKFRAPEFLQGLVISGATAFAAAPLAMKLGLTFEEAIALSMVAGIFISSGPLIFGEPMAPCWVTPAVPKVMGALAAAGLYGAGAYTHLALSTTPFFGFIVIYRSCRINFLIYR